MMKKTALFLVCTCFTLVSLHAQGPRDKIKTLKVAYITEQLQLSSDEAQKFWPVYNAYEEKMKQSRMEKLTIMKRYLKDNDMDNVDEADAEKMLDEIEAVEDRIHLVQKQLRKDLQKVISAKKILLLKEAEDGFAKRLLNELREHRRKRLNGN